MRRTLENGYELDDDRSRLDRAAIHAFLTASYWAEGRTRERQDELIEASGHVVGLYKDGGQIGFARAVDCDAAGFVYLADVYVLDDHRGHGLGVELVREMIERGPSPTGDGSSTRATRTRCTRSSASRLKSGSCSAGSVLTSGAGYVSLPPSKPGDRKVGGLRRFWGR